MQRAPSDTLRITHRLPDRLSGLVDEFAQYGGLRSAQDIALRRLTLQQEPDLSYSCVRFSVNDSDVFVQFYAIQLRTIF